MGFHERTRLKKKLKALIHIGGSYLQLHSIQWAKGVGLSVLLVDKNADNPGKEFADHYEKISGTDVPALLSFAQKMSDKYDIKGAYCSNDFGLPAVAALAEKLDFSGNGIKVVNQTLDKYQAKEIWKSQNLSIPHGVVVEELSQLQKAAKGIELPVIVKPIDSSGSRGVRSVNSFDEIEEAYHLAKKYSDQILVEELVSGRHIDVNGLFIEGKFYPCGATMERYFSPPPYHYPLWGCDPSSLSVEENDKVYQLVEEASRSLGICQGPVKADIIWSDSGPKLIELAPRFHGDVSSSYVRLFTEGANPIKAWMAYLAGESFEQYLLCSPQQFAGYIGLFPPKAGTLLAIKGIDKIRSIKGVSDVYLSAKPGQEIKEPKDNTSLCGFIWATGSTREALHETLVNAKNKLIFEIDSRRQDV